MDYLKMAWDIYKAEVIKLEKWHSGKVMPLGLERDKKLEEMRSKNNNEFYDSCKGFNEKHDFILGSMKKSYIQTRDQMENAKNEEEKKAFYDEFSAETNRQKTLLDDEK